MLKLFLIISFTLIAALIVYGVTLIPARSAAPSPRPASTVPRAQPSQTVPPAFPAASATATISGIVTFTGSLPADPQYSLVVSKDHQLANVVIYVKRFPSAWTFPPSDKTETVTIQNSRFEPHVLAIQSGDTVVVHNLDTVAHAPYFVPEFSPGEQEERAKELKRTFTEPKVFETLICNIHGSMSAKIAVIEHPIFAVSASDGAFTLPQKLPPGKYLLEAVHERLGTRTIELEISPTETVKHMSVAF